MKITRAASVKGHAPQEAVVQPAQQLATPFGVDETAELVRDLLGHTTLIDPDALELVWGRTTSDPPSPRPSSTRV